MWRSLRYLVIAASICACAASRDESPPAAGEVRIHNAIDFGVASSTYFVVNRVDGVEVHRKFDRDPFVEVAAGRRRIEVRFYSESLSTSRRGLGECAIELDAEDGLSYYLEGGVGRSRWWARLVDSSGAITACVFGDGTTEGRIAGGDQDHAVSARPSPPDSAPADIPVAPEVADAPPRATSSPVTVDPAPRQETIAAASGVAAPPAPSSPESQARRAAERNHSEDDEYLVISAMRGRGHRGCSAGRFLVSDVSGELLSLSGNERVRLLGVLPASDGVDAAYTEALRKVVGECVEVELDPGLTERGHHDRDGNLLAYVRAEDDLLLNAEVVRLGVATVDTSWRGRYLAELLAAQAEAKSALE